MSLPLAFGLPSTPDLIVIVLLVVLLFGAKKLPELARGLGQSLGEFKKAKDEFEREVQKTTAPAPPAPPVAQLTPPAAVPTQAPIPADNIPTTPVHTDPPAQA